MMGDTEKIVISDNIISKTRNLPSWFLQNQANDELDHSNIESKGRKRKISKENDNQLVKNHHLMKLQKEEIEHEKENVLNGNSYDETMNCLSHNVKTEPFCDSENIIIKIEKNNDEVPVVKTELNFDDISDTTNTTNNQVEVEQPEIVESLNNYNKIEKEIDKNNSTSSILSNTGPSKTETRKRINPRCKYGNTCYRHNSQHKKDFSHPNDSDYELDSEEELECDENKPACRYGTSCYRKNEAHKRRFNHKNPPLTQIPAKYINSAAVQKRSNGSSSDDSYDYDDPFINDDSSDDYEPTDTDDSSIDYELNDESDEENKNKKRMLKEAKRFVQK